jgi:uncharacterized protein (TIGR02300 family)
MASPTKATRGTKRTCQNSDCGSRFYDLGRNPIECPICGETYAIAVSAPPGAVAAAARKPVSKVPEFEAADDQKPGDVPEAEAEEALADIEVGDEPVAVADDETFLEEEEDAGSDVSAIVGGPEGEEEQ